MHFRAHGIEGFIPWEHTSVRTQIVDVPVPQILEEPDAPVLQFQEETVERSYPVAETRL